MAVETTVLQQTPSTAAPVTEEFVGKPAVKNSTPDPVSESLRIAADQKAAADAKALEDAPLEGTEVPLEEVKVEDKPDDANLGARFAALTRREKQLQEREKAAKQGDEQVKRFTKAIENIKQDPLAALKEVGLTFEDLAQAYLRAQDPNHVPSPEEKIKSIEERLAQKEAQEAKFKADQESKELEEKQRYIDESINAFKTKLREQVASQAEKYELVQANDAIDMVYEVIESYFQENEEMLDPAQALDAVEAHLEEEAKKIMKLKKFAPKSTEQAPKVQDSTPDVRANPSTTLTNKNVSAQAATKPTGLSREESLKRAASLIQWD